jgi:DNA-binding CsgD family transcriptional regulator
VATSGGDPDTQRERAANQGRNPAGHFTRDPDIARRNRDAADLRRQGWSYRKIAAHFGIDVKTAWNAVNKAYEDIAGEPVKEARTLELDRLDDELVRLNDLEEAVRVVLNRHHVTVSNGQVVRLDGEPILDDAPVLQAADRLIKIEEQRGRNHDRRARLLGLAQPAKVEHSGGVKYEVVGVDPEDLV